MKKDQHLPIENIHSSNRSEKPLPNTITSCTLTTEEDHQTKQIHGISHKTDIVDQIVEIISIERTIHVQVQTDQIIRLKPVPIHTLGIGTIPMIDQETPRTKEV